MPDGGAVALLVRHLVFFDTPIYVLFLGLVVVAYWRLRWRQQNVMLLVASYVFYGWWDPRFLSLIAVSTVVDFFCAKAIAGSQDARRRRTLLIVSLSINLGFLAAFKYFNFFVDSFAATLETLGFHYVPTGVLRILLPPGISFYTFQEVAYIVDVYKRKLEPADSLVDYALFISLFPHLIAGPIQRPGHLLPQVQAPRRFDADRVFSGLLLILSGLFRKAVIADNCALLADAAFSGRLGPPNLAVIAIGTYAFAWQIYGDFSGYSDIARGSAQLLGFHFMVNFRQPYLATSLQDFWRRWHISLSSWLRDYLYIPLGGSRYGERQTYRNLMLTMLLGGLWHGANWTFVIWGGIHGAGLAVERVVRRAFHLAELGDMMNYSSVVDATPIVDEEIRRKARPRVEALSQLAQSHHSRFVVLIAPVLSTVDGAKGMIDAAADAHVPVLRPVPSGSLGADHYRDAGFHLNAMGAGRFTEQLIPALRGELARLSLRAEADTGHSTSGASRSAE